MVNGIVYVQCERWVIKLSLKEKYLVVFWCHKKKTFLYKEDRETFFDIIFYIFDKWRKRVEKKY